MAIRRLYFRCTGGDFHDSVVCPFDGWSAPYANDIVSTAARLMSTGESLSIEQLRRSGISDAALHWVVVVDFGDERSAFDALSPDQLGWPAFVRRARAVREMVFRLYFRSDGGDNDDSVVYSPIDCWSSPEAEEIARVAAPLTSTGRLVSIKRLRAEGIPEAALRRLIVIDFGDVEAVFRFLHIAR
jgi:hypothetical protein